MEQQPVQPSEPINLTIKKSKSKRATPAKKPKVVADVIERIPEPAKAVEQPQAAPVAVEPPKAIEQPQAAPTPKPAKAAAPKPKQPKKTAAATDTPTQSPAEPDPQEVERQRYREQMEMAATLSKQLEDLEQRVQGRKTARQNVVLLERIEELQEQLKELGDYVEFKPRSRAATAPIQVPKASFQNAEEVPKRLPASQIVKSFGF